jgi:hypothetical protein
LISGWLALSHHGWDPVPHKPEIELFKRLGSLVFLLKADKGLALVDSFSSPCNSCDTSLSPVIYKSTPSGDGGGGKAELGAECRQDIQSKLQTLAFLNPGVIHTWPGRSKTNTSSFPKCFFPS